MSGRNRVLLLLLGIELMAVLAAVGWQLSRPTPPEVNLSRLPAATADALRKLRSAVWTDTVASWQELGEAYLAYGYFAEAEVCLRRAAQRAPHRYTPVFEHACSLERLGRLQAANEQFAAAAKVGMGNQVQVCHYRIARNALRLNDVAAAESSFAKSPTLPASRWSAARLLIRTDRPVLAVSILAQLREERELDIGTEMTTVQASFALHLPREAAQAAERAERAQRRFAATDYWEQFTPIRKRYGLLAAFSRIEQLTQAERPQEAAAAFDRLMVEVPLEFLEPIVSNGVRLDLEAQRPQAALEKLDRLATRMDLPPVLRHLRGFALAGAGQLDRAVEEWTLANQLQSSAMTHRALAEVLGDRGDHQRADQEQVQARLHQAIDDYHANDLEAALQNLEEVCSRAPQERQVWYYLGLTRTALGQAEEARQAFSRCLSLDPYHGRAKQFLGVLP